MDHYTKFAELKKFTDRVGIIYGTEDFAIYLYSVIKMFKPKVVVELGTGVGTTALWSALALQENNQGIIHTIDDGGAWKEISEKIPETFEEFFCKDYNNYINNLVLHFNLNNYINFINKKIDIVDTESVDILFSDFAHGSYDVLKLLADYLPRMSDNSYIFIDSASTNYSSFHTLESTINLLNSGKIPKTLLEMIRPGDIESFYNTVQSSTFKINHIIENKKRAQNSTASISISPVDVIPQPRLNIRF